MRERERVRMDERRPKSGDKEEKRDGELTWNYECLGIHENHFPLLSDLVGTSMNPRLGWIQSG